MLLGKKQSYMYQSYIPKLEEPSARLEAKLCFDLINYICQMAYTLSGNSDLLFYLNYSIYIVLGYFTYTVV